jgi:hypothetical protein
MFFMIPTPVPPRCMNAERLVPLLLSCDPQVLAASLQRVNKDFTRSLAFHIPVFESGLRIGEAGAALSNSWLLEPSHA